MEIKLCIFLFSYVRGARKITLKPLNFDNFQKRPPHDNSKSELRFQFSLYSDGKARMMPNVSELWEPPDLLDMWWGWKERYQEGDTAFPAKEQVGA